MSKARPRPSRVRPLPNEDLHKGEKCIVFTADLLDESTIKPRRIKRVQAIFGDPQIAGMVTVTENKDAPSRPILEFMVRRVDQPPTSEYRGAMPPATMRALSAALAATVQWAEHRHIVRPSAKRKQTARAK